MPDSYKRTISENDYFALLGLVELAHRAYKSMSDVDRAMCAILEYESDYHTTSCGLLSDEYFEDTPNVKATLKAMKVKIERRRKHKTAKTST